MLFAVANAFPFLCFEMKGDITTTTLLSGVLDLWKQGKHEIAVLVGFTAVVAPLLQIVLLLYVLLPVHLDRVPWQMAPAFRLLRRIMPWSMMEVFLIGILVAVDEARRHGDGRAGPRDLGLRAADDRARGRDGVSRSARGLGAAGGAGVSAAPRHCARRVLRALRGLPAPLPPARAARRTARSARAAARRSTRARSAAWSAPGPS